MDVPEKRQGEAKIARRPKRKAVAPKPTRSPGPLRRDDKLDCRALIVGINDYQGTVNDLPSCVNDARAVDELVRGAYKFTSTKVLLDADATIANVATELERLFSKAAADTRLLFYYSGHGSTERKGSTLEECLSLYDGSYFDDGLVQLAAAAPPGIFTAVFDSCFSGGMDKQLLKTAIRPEGNIERARVKAFLREDPQEFLAHARDQEDVQYGKQFFGPPFVPPITVVNEVLCGETLEKALIPAPPSDEAGQKPLNGLLLSACLETETAAASTASTDGKSSFTYALLDALKATGYRASSSAVIEAVQQKLKRMGFRQTPLIKEPQQPGRLGERAFLTFEDAKSGAPAAPVVATGDATTALANLLTQIVSGGSAMDPAVIIQLITALSKSSQPAPKSKGIGDLLPIILPLILKSAAPAQPAGKGLVDILPVILPLILKSGQATQDKLFGIDDAILIPALASIITSAINKGSAPADKFFGIDDAIIGPVLVHIATEALRR